MKTSEFRERFEVDRSVRLPKAVPRVVPADEQPAEIADGSPWVPGQIYHYFDRAARVVRDTQGLHRRGECFLGGDTINVVAISDLHNTRNDAVDAAQKILLDEMQQLRDSIEALEASKPKGERSLKRILQARNY